MNYYLTIITLVLLVILVLYQWKIWHFRIFLSPAFYFSFFWLFGPVFLLIFYNNYSYDPYPEYINELNYLISFTAICFIFWTNKGRRDICQEPIIIKFVNARLFNFLSVLLLLVSLYDFLRLGANLNMGDARENVQYIVDSQSIIVGYAKTLAYPLSLYAGYKLADNYLIIRNVGSKFLFVPLIANIIFSITLGGRVDIMFSFINYIMGAFFALPIRTSLRSIKNFLLFVIVSSLLLIAFINAVQSQRSANTSGFKDPVEVYLDRNLPFLSVFYSPMSYVKSSYTGYQLRRVDAVDEKKLGWGRYTFNGFINWTIPFGGLVGLGNLSIAKVFGIYYNPLETYDYEREQYYITHSSYLTLIKDYGFGGSLFCIFFLTWIAHFLFVRIQTKSYIRYLSSFYFFYLFWNYWIRSVFYCSLSSSVLIPLYGFLLIDLLNRFVKKRN